MSYQLTVPVTANKKVAWNKGLTGIYSEQTLQMMSIAAKKRIGENSANWKRNDLSYSTLHRRIQMLLPKPKECPECGIDVKLEVCNISKESNVLERYKVKDPIILSTYNLDLKNWFYACRGCHKKYEARLVRETSNVG